MDALFSSLSVLFILRRLSVFKMDKIECTNACTLTREGVTQVLAPYEVTRVITYSGAMDERWLHYPDHVVHDTTKEHVVMYQGRCIDGFS